jgi:hypothetical protein
MVRAWWTRTCGSPYQFPGTGSVHTAHQLPPSATTSPSAATAADSRRPLVNPDLVRFVIETPPLPAYSR